MLRWGLRGDLADLTAVSVGRLLSGGLGWGLGLQGWPAVMHLLIIYIYRYIYIYNNLVGKDLFKKSKGRSYFFLLGRYVYSIKIEHKGYEEGGVLIAG